MSGPRTTLPAPSVTALRETFNHENQLWKAGDHYRQGRVRDAYNAWFRESVKNGHPPDSLTRRIGNERERFLDKTIAGLDGHAFWDGPERFILNDGSRRNPRWWWYEHVHGPTEKRSTIKPVCDEPHCIAPEHQAVTSWSETQRRFSDAQCIGALQVAAMRLGYTPSTFKYRTLGLSPGEKIILMRFSSWARACAAAGLEPVTSQSGYVEKYTDDECLEALRQWKQERGAAPVGLHWTREGRLPSEWTIRRRFGSWNVALIRAGLK
jgi:hypothetical protein